MIRERINSGLDRAREARRRLGRPALGQSVRDQVLDLRSQGRSVRKIATELSIGISSVKRIMLQSTVTTHSDDTTLYDLTQS